jgi:hypothetical protein
MKKIVEVQEVEGKGLVALMGQKITLFCINYIYTGKLTGVNEKCVLLEDASIVYETGAFNEAQWKDAQALPKPLYVMQSAIESFCVLKES